MSIVKLYKLGILLLCKLLVLNKILKNNLTFTHFVYIIVSKEVGLVTKIRELRKNMNLSAAEVSKRLGIPYTTYINYDRGEREPNSEMLIKLANFFDVSIDYMLGRSHSDADEIFSTYDNIIPIKTQKIPLLGEIACGEPIVANREHEVYVEATTDIHADYAVKARGDSMINARIYDGDIVFIREQPDVENGEIAAVVIEDDITLKRVYKENNALELRAENPRIRPLIYRGEELNHIRILGKAIAFQSDII